MPRASCRVGATSPTISTDSSRLTTRAPSHAYARAYQAQRARIQGGQLDRTNTLIKLEGSTAWATYQWEYFAVIDQAQHDVRGHTTLVLEKQGDDWVIVLDHTSVVSDTLGQASTSAPAPAQPPAANPGPGQH